MVAPTNPMMWHKVAAVSGNPSSCSCFLPSSCFLQPSDQLTGSIGLSRGRRAGARHLRRAHVPPQEPAYKDVNDPFPLPPSPPLSSLLLPARFVGLIRAKIGFGGLLTAGILLFSGTCYTVAYLEDRKFSSPAPLGGFAFIAAWASLLF
ncbi:hypothetical protein PR202_gb10932 [Eleusine coracana subsp. coracana]|uniref:Uncharacterized protein n=1 Tax=Eleusine coracana subsp. coracana TaxID=191504 RepID=A0AAV5EM57_ELECO|nr:hypothetical protein PR202_gb10932 [Eleusine coracana subsp. coracana]